MSAILTIQNVSKAFGTRVVLRGASFAVHEGDRIGLVGINGAGKSTLLRLLVDPAAEPDEGLITRKRDLGIEYVPQEPVLDPELNVEESVRQGLRTRETILARLENLAARIPTLEEEALASALDEQARLHHQLEEAGGWDASHEIRGLAASLKLPPSDRSITALSIGERRRVALARALIGRPDVLALDEPTNHLDAATVEWLEGRLRQHDGALMLVTHDRYFLDRVVTRILELDRGHLYAYEANYTGFLEKQAERLENETAREQARASFVRRELDWIKRGPAARTTKQKARVDRFDAAVAAEPTAADKPAGRVSLSLPMEKRLGKTVLEVRGLSQVEPGGERVLFEGLDLIVQRGDRIGVVGPNGVGKTTLVRTLVGQLAAAAGEIVVGTHTHFAYLDQGRAELRDDKTVLEEVAGDNDRVTLASGQSVHARTFLRMMLFDDGFANTPVGTLSGGERNRVQLAKLLRMGGNFLVLDEPTNDLDLVTLGVLEEALAEFPGCALVVSHDRWFLDRVATRILSFEEDGRIGLYAGNYQSFLQQRAASGAPRRPKADKGEAAPKARRPERTQAADGPKRLSYKEKQELAGIEEAILVAEAELEEVQAALGDPALYRERPGEVAELNDRLETAKAEVDRLYARWEELETRSRIK